MEKMDRGALIDAAEAMVPLTDPKLLDQLKECPRTATSPSRASWAGWWRRSTRRPAPSSSAARARTPIELDRMQGVAAVIDLGGDNTYEEGTTSLERPVLLVVNLGGGNVFRGTKPGIQGGAILGVSML